MKADRKLLPVVVVEDTKFLVDIERREFRAFRDAGHRIDMHSIQGREMIKAIMGQEWRIHGRDNLPSVSECVK
ncbi:MAG: hypothetical protein JXD22_14905 [Sedimentisphaerales bacterium]|nr:hypothetical protein [Sedimentisphaerales bacterium]